LICANLPYIPSQVLQGLEISGKEPDLALNGGPDGMDLVRALLYAAPQYLAPGGLVLLEIDSAQGNEAGKLAERSFPGARIEILPDLAGQDRLVTVQTQF
jgi:release factor glutamine methyltransferase